MDPEIDYFACLLLEKNMCRREDLRKVREACPPDADLLVFAETLIDLAICDDVERVQDLLDEACACLDTGESAAFDPFALPLKPRLAPAPPADSPPAKASIAPKPPINPRPLTRPPFAAKLPAKPVEMPAAKPAENPRNAPQEMAAPTQAAAAPAHEDHTPTPAQEGSPAVRPAEPVMASENCQPAMPDWNQLERSSAPALRECLVSLLRQSTANGDSDLHLCALARPFVRRLRQVEYLDNKPFTSDLAQRCIDALLTPAQQEWFRARKDYDFALALSTGERYRVNLMQHKDGVQGVFRTIPSRIPSLTELGFSEKHAEVITKLLAYHNGLILVTGPVGSGKTTTLAALVNAINQTRTDHIITVEEPIEIVHRSQSCSLTQRSVGPHTRTFHSALKGALRQDPDIIVIGEMRDLETIEMAISASETGHLVIGTMHTAGAAGTLNRLLDVFPPAQQTQIRAMVAESLRGILCQRLLPGTDGSLQLAVEILLRNTAVSSLIREGKSEGLGNIMETGKRDGMVTMDNSILDLWRAGRISDETALDNIQNSMLRREISEAASAASTDSFPDPRETPTQPKKRGFFG